MPTDNHEIEKTKNPTLIEWIFTYYSSLSKNPSQCKHLSVVIIKYNAITSLKD